MVKTAEAKQACRAASTVVYPALEFGIKPCGSYTREDFLEVLSRVAFEQEFANTAGKTCQLDHGEPVDVTSTARNGLANQIGDFLPRTSSPTFSVRLFYFLFAVSMYNLWILANVLVSAGAVPEKPPISTRVFREFVLVTDYG